jgi:hypothetical protein
MYTNTALLTGCRDVVASMNYWGRFIEIFLTLTTEKQDGIVVA